ncbi:MAG TPA: DUF4352 domain-containing protein [Ktedonobacteraceae bacterium]
MATTPASFCPQCGARIQGNSRFCTNCGATIETHANGPTIGASGAPNTPPAGSPIAPGPANPGIETAPAAFTPDALARKSSYIQPNEALIPPPPPDTISNKPTYNEALLAPPPPPPVYNPYAGNATEGPPSYVPNTVPDTYTPPITIPPLQSGTYQVPAYAQKQKGNRGCVITSIVLLLVLALGIGGVVYLVRFFTNYSSATNNPGPSSTASSGNTPGTTPTAGTHASSSEHLKLQFTYASVQITVTSVELASTFGDDTSTTPGSAGVVRVNLRENNTSAGNPDYILYESMHLLLPGGNALQAGSEQASISPAQGVSRTNWLDFALDNQVALNQLTLRIGTQKQFQFDIPLQPDANLGKYQDKTSNLNLQFKYGDATITLKTATLSYSYNDYQATTGNRYLILTLAGNNNTSNSTDVYPPSYMRLQVAGNSLQPDASSTFPYSIAPNASASGTAVFLVPQDATSFTLVMLAQQTSPPVNQVTQVFQVQ